jgi:hypothetical protein
MDAAYKANPRFDPQRNAAELGLRNIPVFFLGGAGSAGSTDETTSASNDWGPRVPWLRLMLLAVLVWAVWKLAR